MLRNVGSNWVLLVVTLASTYFLTPFVIHTLGPDAYGTWLLITAMTGYISLLALGVPMACVRYLSADVANGQTDRMNETIGSCAGLYLGCGAAAILLGGAMMGWFATYDLAPGLRSQALLAFALMALNVSAGFIGLLPEGILFAHHDFVARNVVRIGGVVLRLGLTASLLMLNASLVVMALVQIVCLLIDFSWSWLIIRRRYPAVRIRVSNLRLTKVREIFSFSLYVLLLSAGARLTFETDALVIGAYRDVTSIAAYGVANSIIINLVSFIIAIGAVVSPMATKLNTEGRREELRDMFLKWSKVAVSLTVITSVCLMVLGPRFLGRWIGPAFERPSGQVLEILLISCLVFMPVRGICLPLLMGLGKPKAPAFAFAVSGVLNLVMSIALVGPFGLAGVAIGTAVPNMLFGVVVFRATCRELGIPVWQTLHYIAARSAIAAVPVIGLLLWVVYGFGVGDMVGLAAAGAVAIALCGVMWVLFVYRNDPYIDIRPYLLRVRPWSRPS